MFGDSGKPLFEDGNPGQGLMPREILEEPKTKGKQLVIGIPKEHRFHETRILLTPHDAGQLVINGHKVVMERDAGQGARFSNEEYAAQGVIITDSRDEVYHSDIILKLMPPSQDEIGMMKSRQILFSTLNFVDNDKHYFQALMQKKVTAICLESIREEDGSYPVIRAMSEIAGNACIYLASRYLSDPRMGQSRMLGGFSGVDPVEIIILGAGTVAEYATRSALGMGAHVKIFDPSIRKIRRLQSLLQERVYTNLLTPDAISKALPTADVVICSMYTHHRETPCVLTEDMVRTMRQGSVLIDISIDRGGCAETSRTTFLNDPVYEKHGVIHYCVPNLLSRFSHTASVALSNYFCRFLEETTESGGVHQILRRIPSLRNSAYLYHGVLTKKSISHKTGLPYKDINLLISSMDQ